MEKVKVMMKLYQFLFFITLLSFPLFYACESEDGIDDEITNKYQNGVFIVNEGNFSDKDGSVSWYDYDSSKVILKIYEIANDIPFAGTLQSMAFYGDKGYLIDNSGRLEIVDEKTFVALNRLNDFDIPRHITFSGDKAYITDWGPYGADFSSTESYVAVIDLDADTILTKIETDSRPEGILLAGGKLYVANSNSSKLTVISPDTDEIEKTIDVPYGPSQLLLDKDGNIWITCLGEFGGNSTLIKINSGSDQIETQVELTGDKLNGRLAINGGGDQLFMMTERWSADYTYTENAVFKIPINFQGSSIEAVVTGTNFYGLGVDPVNNMLYVADANAFSGNGTVIRFDLNGTEIDDLAVGRGPRDFVFKSTME
ncbi:YncE family protein [Bacteroidota bacterium]